MREVSRDEFIAVRPKRSCIDIDQGCPKDDTRKSFRRLTKTEEKMEQSDMYVVIGVVAAFALFAVVLAWVSRGSHN